MLRSPAPAIGGAAPPRAAWVGGLVAAICALTSVPVAWAGPAPIPTAPTATTAPSKAAITTAAITTAAITTAAITTAAKKLPIAFDIHGYYRARYVRLGNAPIGRLDDDGYLASAVHTGRDDASDGHFAFMRLRLEPTLRFGGEPARGVLPKAALHAQVDLLDNVLFGDNARQASVPLFAENPSGTGVGGDERPALLLRRLWLDLKIPVGLLKIGRQASHGGLGLLFNDGNGFRNDFGDALGGSTFDRVAFATRPITIFNALTKGDKRPTPLILVVGHDWLVEDALGFGSDPLAANSRLRAGPFGLLTTPTCGNGADPDGVAPTAKCDDDVSQWLTALIWKDPDLRITRASDELLLGLVYVSRGQAFNASRMRIIDGFWRFRVGLGASGPSLLTEGEFSMIRGSTKGLKLLPGGLFDETTGLAANALEGDILNAAARVGLTAPTWDALLEWGTASGDPELIGGDRVFRTFPVNDDYKMGLLMYPVALYGRSVNTAAGRASGALHSGGGVFNSSYLNLKARYRMTKPTWQLETVLQGVVAWANTLNGGKVLGFTADYFAPRDANDPWANNTCSALDSACLLGWEADLALKLKWLPANLPGAAARDRYHLRWSNELGVMSAGAALAPRLAEGADLLWTLQTRIALVW